jgi:hydroxymethylbilane synthase
MISTGPAMPDATRPFRIATRGSALALAQANLILAQCRAAFPARSFELAIIKTTGDKLLTASLANPELPKGLFTKELEVALTNGDAELAVHSLKDLPTSLPPGLALGAVGPRADARDALVCRRATLSSQPPPGGALASLPTGAVVATSSTRRRAQLLERRPDLQVVPIRGNVGTRLRKLAEQPELTALLLAAAGLERLGFQVQAEGCLTGADVPQNLQVTRLEPEDMLPCVGQAALGIEIRDQDSEARTVCARLDDPATHACVVAERAFLRAMGGGCQLAVAAYARIQAGQLHLRAVSFLADVPRRAEGTDHPSAAETLGQRLAAAISSSTST